MSARHLSLSEMRHRLPQRRVVGLHPLWEEVERARLQGPVGLAVHHLGRALRMVASAPLSGCLTILSACLVLVPLGLFLTLFTQLWGGIEGQRSNLGITVFMSSALDPAERARMEREFSSFEGVERVQWVSPQEAFQRLSSSLGDQADALAGINPGDTAQNPLPESFEITLSAESPVNVQELAGRIEGRPRVDAVMYDRGVYAEIEQLLRSLSWIGWTAVPLLLVMVVFIISSTLRLSLHAHREEIQIMRLVGARHEYVRAPFLLAALIQSACGALLAVAVVWILLGQFGRYAQQSGALHALFSIEVGLPLWIAVVMLMVGVASGLIASALTLRRFSGNV